MPRIWNKHKQSNTPLKRKVFVAMSGGVDSSVTALLLKNEGYDVVGVFMRCFSARGGSAFGGNVDGCQQEEDAEDARRVAEKLKIPFYVWDFEEEYKKKVVKYMVDGYRRGITPNPDVMCNKEIKFGLFFDRAIAAGADFVATGHYARVRELKTKNSKLKTFRLFKAVDKNKDQSYFLWTLTQKQLTRCLFPIGEYVKPEVRAIARKAKLPTAEKKDSQGICFLGKVPLADFLKLYIRPRRGEIVTMAGERIGAHEGIYFYTIGQRHLGISNLMPKISKGKGDQKPLYVSEKNAKTNTLVVAEGENNRALYRKEIELIGVNFINQGFTGLIRANSGIRKNRAIEVLARVRYRQPVSPAKLSRAKAGFKIIFNKPQKFVAPGQSAVFYSKAGEMLGGGVIQ